MSSGPLMTGFPPAPESQVTLANWRTAPFNRWAFQHVRELIPSADIPNDPDRVWALPSALVDMADFSFEYEGRQLNLQSFLAATDTDGFVVLHRGSIIAEQYAHGMTRRTPHILMSVSKSLLGIIAGILTDRGQLDPHALVTSLVPEVAGTAYVGARIRDLLDMRVGIEFDENYLAAAGPIIEYRKSHNWNPLEPGDVPTDMRSFFAKLTAKDGQHSARFHYVSPNTDLMGWVIERATNRRYCDLLSELLWQPVGAEDSAYITVDRLGAPRCAGGICTTTVDLARVGQLMVQGGKRGGTVIPERWIDDLVDKGAPDAWDVGDFLNYFPNLPMHYRDKWYVLRHPQPVLFGFGVFGQNLFVDRANELVIAKLSSQAMPMDERLISLTVQGVSALLNYLGRGRQT